jgi:phosphoribosyl-AMP cyclohydrolase
MYNPILQKDATMKNLKFDEKGLLTAVAQDANTKQVLMVAMMNAEAFQKTVATQKAHFWSRSRQTLWLKGETSGNILEVVEMHLDCDADAVLLLVEPCGPACHTGEISCFYTPMELT